MHHQGGKRLRTVIEKRIDIKEGVAADHQDRKGTVVAATQGVDHIQDHLVLTGLVGQNDEINMMMMSMTHVRNQG